MTSLVYRADSPADPFPLLTRHFARLRKAHAALARERPDCWCASRSMPDDEAMLAALQGAVTRVQSEGLKGDLRVRFSRPSHKLEHDTRTAQADAVSPPKIRLTVTEDGQPKVEAFPLAPMPSCNSFSLSPFLPF